MHCHTGLFLYFIILELLKKEKHLIQSIVSWGCHKKPGYHSGDTNISDVTTNEKQGFQSPALHLMGFYTDYPLLWRLNSSRLARFLAIVSFHMEM